MKVLYAGHFWSGATGRSIKDAMTRLDGVEVIEFDLDPYTPHGHSFRTRALYKLIRNWQMADCRKMLLKTARDVKPDAIITTKGSALDAVTIKALQRDVCPVFNHWPDPSPLAFGSVIREAVGAYDAVFSTKRHHPGIWASEYGYSNPCYHVPHGYSPETHFCESYPDEGAQDFDVISIASGRPEYYELIGDFAKALGGRKIRTGLGGAAWDRYPGGLPDRFENIGAHFGRAYTNWLRRGKIVLAPVMTGVTVNGEIKRGDEVTERSYQCGAAHVFFIHTLTDEAKELYDPETEVPMYSDAGDLAEKVLHFLDRPDERRQMAEAAHRRAVPVYSHDARASRIVDLMRQTIAGNT